MAGIDNPFDPDKILIKLSKHPQDCWTIDDAMKGTSIMGGTGSGKTTASGKEIAIKFLQEGWGGLVLCAKSDEAELWTNYCIKAGRERDLIIFGKNSIHTSGKYKGQKIVFNPIDYESKRKGEGAGETQNLANIFMSIYRMGNRIAGEGNSKDERYWDSALKRCLNRVIELLKLADEDLSYFNMAKIISSSDSLQEISFTDYLALYEQNENYASTFDADSKYCVKCLFKAYLKYKTADEQYKYTFHLVEDYFSHIMPTMGEKVKPIVTESVMGVAEPFLIGLLQSQFSGKTNIFPEWTIEQQKIIVLDFPIKEFLDTGIIAQSLFKLLFQQAAERRNVNEHPIPIFLWCDEAHYFINAYDQIFLTTARGSRTATVFLSQNISNYFAVMGGHSDATARVDSLMGNLSTKIFHANSDARTNEYASRLIGDSMAELETFGMSHKHFSLEFGMSEGINRQYLPQVRPMEFTTLKSGGSRNEFEVQGIIMVSGREWSDERNFLRKVFVQDFKK